MTTREKFEDWVKSVPWHGRGNPLKLDPDTGGYWEAEIHVAWNAWQARQPEIDTMAKELIRMQNLIASLCEPPLSDSP